MTGDHAILRHYLAPLEPILALPDLTELVINRPGEIGTECAGAWRWIEAPELTEGWLMTLAQAAAAYTAQDVGPAHPICSTLLPNGARCQIVLPPVAPAATFCLRKAARLDLSLEALAAQGAFEQAALEDQGRSRQTAALCAAHKARDWTKFFRLAVATRRNILISGATGSGKTTLAKALIAEIPAHERLITIEDVEELAPPQRNVVRLIYAKDAHGPAALGPKALLESALRMRPDRILLHELRDAAAFYFLRNVNSGHPGSITTVHADSAELAFEQLTLLVKESEGGRDLSRADIHALLRQLIDIVVQMRRHDGAYRVSEVWYEPARTGALA